MKKRAFTLAEMMIVMLVVAIIIAAITPTMTKRRRSSTTGPWEWASNHYDAYYGTGQDQTAMIGQLAQDSNDKNYNAKLIIKNAGDKINHILFKNTSGVLGSLGMDYNASGGNIYFGGPYKNGIGGKLNTAIGLSALTNNSGDSNVAVGANTLSQNTSGAYNTAIGFNALTKNKAGAKNTAIGYGALSSYSTNYAGDGETAIGYNALAKHNYYLGSNTAVGSSALAECVNGLENTAVGYHALSKNTDDNNTAVGYNALQSNTTGYQNTAVGTVALTWNTTGKYNTAVGDGALNQVTTGSYNTAIGDGACAGVTSGDYKTCIGKGSTAYPSGTDTKYRVITLGDSSTTVYIPGNLVVGKVTYLGMDIKNNDTIFISYHDGDWGYGTVGTLYEKGSNNTIWYQQDGYEAVDNFKKKNIPQIYSDSRLKNVKGENKAGLDKIRQLKVFDYTFKKDKTPHVGVIAQDLQKVFPNAVKKGKDGYLMIRMEDMFYAVVNAIKELDQTLQALEKKVDTLIAQQKENTKRIDTLEQQVKNLSVGAPTDAKLHCLGPVCVIGK